MSDHISRIGCTCIFKGDCSDSDTEKLQRDLKPLRKKLKKGTERPQISLGHLSYETRSEAGSSIIAHSENRFPVVVFKLLKEVRKVWLVKNASATVVHSPTGLITLQPIPVLRKKWKTQLSK